MKKHTTVESQVKLGEGALFPGCPVIKATDVIKFDRLTDAFRSVGPRTEKVTDPKTGEVFTRIVEPFTRGDTCAIGLTTKDLASGIFDMQMKAIERDFERAILGDCVDKDGKPVAPTDDDTFALAAGGPEDVCDPQHVLGATLIGKKTGRDFYVESFSAGRYVLKHHCPLRQEDQREDHDWRSIWDHFKRAKGAGFGVAPKTKSEKLDVKYLMPDGIGLTVRHTAGGAVKDAERSRFAPLTSASCAPLKSTRAVAERSVAKAAEAEALRRELATPPQGYSVAVWHAFVCSAGEDTYGKRQALTAADVASLRGWVEDGSVPIPERLRAADCQRIGPKPLVAYRFDRRGGR